jgi:hypothetical protein
LFATEEGNRGFSESHPESKSANEDGTTAEGDSARVDGNSERAGPKGGRRQNSNSFADSRLRVKFQRAVLQHALAPSRGHYVLVMKKSLVLDRRFAEKGPRPQDGAGRKNADGRSVGKTIY